MLADGAKEGEVDTWSKEGEVDTWSPYSSQGSDYYPSDASSNTDYGSDPEWADYYAMYTGHDRDAVRKLGDQEDVSVYGAWTGSSLNRKQLDGPKKKKRSGDSEDAGRKQKPSSGRKQGKNPAWNHNEAEISMRKQQKQVESSGRRKRAVKLAKERAREKKWNVASFE
jgi:hypothetical protein